MNRLDASSGRRTGGTSTSRSEHSVLCKLTIRLPDGSTLTKADAGGYAGMSDQGDDDKSGYSDAFKRAAVKFGVARYLYRDGVPEFVRERVKAEELTPAEPAAAAPAGPRPRAPRAAQPRSQQSQAATAERPPAAGRRQRDRRHAAAVGPGAVRLGQGPGAAARGRPAPIPEQVGQAPGLSGPDGRLGRRAGRQRLPGGDPEDPGERSPTVTRPSRRRWPTDRPAPADRSRSARRGPPDGQPGPALADRRPLGPVAAPALPPREDAGAASRFRRDRSGLLGHGLRGLAEPLERPADRRHVAAGRRLASARRGRGAVAFAAGRRAWARATSSSRTAR